MKMKHNIINENINLVKQISFKRVLLKMIR